MGHDGEELWPAGLVLLWASVSVHYLKSLFICTYYNAKRYIYFSDSLGRFSCYSTQL